MNKFYIPIIGGLFIIPFIFLGGYVIDTIAYKNRLASYHYSTTAQVDTVLFLGNNKHLPFRLFFSYQDKNGVTQFFEKDSKIAYPKEMLFPIKYNLRNPSSVVIDYRQFIEWESFKISMKESFTEGIVIKIVPIDNTASSSNG